MIAVLTRFRELTAGDRRLVITAAIALPVAAVVVRVWPWSRLQRQLARPVRRFAGHDESARARHLARMVIAASNRGFYQPGCLPKSVALQWLLRREGIAATLCVGVRRDDRRLDAHAWVEHRGLPLLDPSSGLERLAEFDASRPVPEAHADR